MPKSRTGLGAQYDPHALPLQFHSSAWVRYRFLALILFLGNLLPSPAAAQIFSSEVKKVSENFVCQCSCNHQLSGCGMLHCGSANPLRSEIDQKLQAGMTEEQIVDDFVAKYGGVILSAPTGEGFDLVAWTLPVVALLAGMLVLYRVVRVWTRRRPLPASTPATPEAIPEQYRNRMEKELKDFD